MSCERPNVLALQLRATIFSAHLRLQRASGKHLLAGIPIVTLRWQNVCIVACE